MTREHPQSPVPRIAGYSVDAIAESAKSQGVRWAAEEYRISQNTVLRALELWRRWKNITHSEGKDSP